MSLVITLNILHNLSDKVDYNGIFRTIYLIIIEIDK